MCSRIFIGFLFWLISSTALAGAEAVKLKEVVWPFDGMFGTVDRQSAQRGAKIYLEVCAVCHSLNRVYYRNLQNIGFSEAEVKELAKNYEISDGPDDSGEMFTRPAMASDRFVPSYPNIQAARAANNGAYPPDLSLMIKARHDGANYLYSLLTGYQEAPEDFILQDGLYYNPYYESKALAMPSPLSPDQVQYADGTKATVEQMSRDLVIFLQWAAEPEMEHRKSMGLKVMIFLSIFTILFFLVKKKIWSDVDPKIDQKN